MAASENNVAYCAWIVVARGEEEHLLGLKHLSLSLV